MRVHSLVTCTSHNHYSPNCCTWTRFLIFSTHHSYYTSITTRFVANDSSFVLALFCYYWLPFHSHESSLHRVFTWFLLIVCFFFSFGCVYLCSHLLYTFDGWVPILDFYLQGFLSFNNIMAYNKVLHVSTKAQPTWYILFIPRTMYIYIYIN